MAPIRYAAKFDPFLSLDYAPRPPQSKERKGSYFAIWQPWSQPPKHLTVIRLGRAGVRDGDTSGDARVYCLRRPSLRAVVCHVIELIPYSPGRNVVARINGGRNYQHNIGILHKHILSGVYF